MTIESPYIWQLLSSERNAILGEFSSPKNRASKIAQFKHYTTDAPI